MKGLIYKMLIFGMFQFVFVDFLLIILIFKDIMITVLLGGWKSGLQFHNFAVLQKMKLIKCGQVLVIIPEERDY